MPVALAFIDFLNSREDANLLWAAIFLCFAAHRFPGVFRDIARLLRNFFLSKLGLLFGAALLYCVTIAYAANELGVWHRPALKATVYWFFVTAFVLVGRALTQSPHDTRIIRSLLPKIAGLSIIVEFSMNLYVLPLLVELLVLPVSLVLVCAPALTSNPAERKRSERGLAALGLIFITYFIVRVATDLDGFLTRKNAEDLLVGPMFTVALIPFLYAAAWISWRERHPRPRSTRITRSEFGDDWPFTVEEAELRGAGSHGFGSVTIKVNGTEYALNGIAKGQHRFEDVELIWADDLETGAKKNIGPIIDRGLKLCA
ncbi:MAG: DUF2511 domain-containing protein [Gaiellaceae bacterium]